MKALSKSFIKEYILQIIFFGLIILITLGYIYGSIAYKKDSNSVRSGFTVINPPEEVSAMVLVNDYIWAGGRDGLYKIDTATAKVVSYPEKSMGMKYIRALLIDSSKALWVGHDNGLSRLSGGAWTTFTKEEGLSDNRVYSLAVDAKGRLWVGTWSGANVFEGGNIRTLTMKEGLLDDMVNVILGDKWGGMWFGSYIAQKGGISYLSPQDKWSYYNIDNGLPHNYVTSLYEDTSGYVWAGTGLLDKGGASVFKLKDDKWNIIETITKSEGLAGEKVRSLYQDNRGVMWLGSEYDGVTIILNGKCKIITSQDGLSDNEVKAMVQDKNGNMWFGTRYGITKVDAEFLNSLYN